MSDHVLSRSASLPRFNNRAAGPDLAPLFWLIVLIGMVGVLMGLYGASTLKHIETIGTVTVSGMNNSVFDHLMFGGLLFAAFGVAGIWRGCAIRKNA